MTAGKQVEEVMAELIASGVRPMPDSLALMVDETFALIASKIPAIAGLVLWEQRGHDAAIHVALRPGLPLDVEAVALEHVAEWRRTGEGIRLVEVPGAGYRMGMVAVAAGGEVST